MQSLSRLGAVGVLVFVSLFSACSGGNSSSTPPPPKPSLVSIQVTGASANLTAGQTQQLKAVGTYSNSTTQDLTNSVSWSTSNAAIANVAPGGLLTAKASGQCSAIASLSGVNGSFGLTITPGLVSISITPAPVTLAAGTTQQFIATGTYSDSSKQNLTTTVTWSSSNTSAATISSAAPTMGLAHAVAPGTSTISASLDSVSGTASLIVSAAIPTSISVTPQNPTLPLGVTQQFTATGTFSDGSVQDITNVVHWSSSSRIAGITVSGLATSTNVGTSTISASFGGATGSTVLTVNAANLNSISIQPANGSIAQGTKFQFAALGTFNDGGIRDITHLVIWSASDTTILKIGSSSGIGFGVAPGSVNVTATLGSNTVSVPFNVTDATVVSVSLAPTSASIPIGGQVDFTAIATFSDLSTQDVSTIVNWSSDTPAVATVGNTSGVYGLAKGVGAGTANISAAFSYAGASATGSSPLAVTSATLISISVTPLSALLAPASALQFTATGTFSDGSRLYINPSVTWSTSDNSVAVVNTTGWVTGQSGGAVSVTAKAGSISGSAQLLVESASLSSIQLTPATTSVPAGVNALFHATGTFSNGDTQDLTAFVTWTSSDPSVATISNTQGSAGETLGIQPGTTTISAVFGGQAGTATLTVNNSTLNLIAITPQTASIQVGTTRQFTATGTFSDGSVFGLTGQANWISSEPNIASVSHGLATGIASGTVTVSASFEGVTGMATLTVQ